MGTRKSCSGRIARPESRITEDDANTSSTSFTLDQRRFRPTFAPEAGRIKCARSSHQPACEIYLSSGGSPATVPTRTSDASVHPPRAHDDSRPSDTPDATQDTPPADRRGCARGHRSCELADDSASAHPGRDGRAWDSSADVLDACQTHGARGAPDLLPSSCAAVSRGHAARSRPGAPGVGYVATIPEAPTAELGLVVPGRPDRRHTHGPASRDRGCPVSDGHAVRRRGRAVQRDGCSGRWRRGRPRETRGAWTASLATISLCTRAASSAAAGTFDAVARASRL